MVRASRSPLPGILRLAAAAVAWMAAAAPRVAVAPLHTTYLWHMHQPLYWPERSTWNDQAYEPTSGGRPRLDPVIVAFHHPIGPLVDDAVFRRMLQIQKVIMPSARGGGPLSTGFFPAQGSYHPQIISRGVTVKVPAPHALRPRHAQHVDPAGVALAR